MMECWPYIGGPWDGEIATFVTDKYEIVRVEMPYPKIYNPVEEIKANQTVSTHHYRLRAIDDENGERFTFWLHDSIKDSEAKARIYEYAKRECLTRR